MLANRGTGDRRKAQATKAPHREVGVQGRIDAEWHDGHKKCRGRGIVLSRTTRLVCSVLVPTHSHQYSLSSLASSDRSKQKSCPGVSTLFFVPAVFGHTLPPA